MSKGMGRTIFLAMLVVGAAWAGPPDGLAADAPAANTPESAKAVWSALMQRQPFGYTPLPPEARTALDGTYTKIDPKQEPQVHCLRCPEYAPEGGLWKINFDRGVFRIMHAVSGWKSIGSFTVQGDRLTLFNDPVCQDESGSYTWSLQEGQLVLRVVEDPCAIRLRAMNLTRQPWLSCRPPNIEAAVTGHWPEPPGCQ